MSEFGPLGRWIVVFKEVELAPVIPFCINVFLNFATNKPGK